MRTVRLAHTSECGYSHETYWFSYLVEHKMTSETYVASMRTVRPAHTGESGYSHETYWFDIVGDMGGRQCVVAND